MNPYFHLELSIDSSPKNANFAAMKSKNLARVANTVFITFSIVSFSIAQSDSIVGFSARNEVVFKGVINQTENWKGLKAALKAFKLANEAVTIGKKSKNWSFYNAKGEKIIDSVDTFIADKNLGVKFSKNYGLGLISNEGLLKVPPQYLEIKMQDGYLLGKAQHSIIIKNEQEQTVKQLRYSFFRFMSPKFGIYGANKKFGIVNTESYRLVSDPVYDEISLFNDTIFLVKLADKYGLLDFKNELLIPVEYSSIEKDTLNFIKLKRERNSNGVLKTSVGMCNYQGRVLIALIYRQIGEYTDGLFPALNDKYWGYLNSEGQEQIPFFYDTYGKFVSGLAALKKNGLVGIINTNGNWVAFPEYESVWYVNDSVWIWRKDYQSGFYSTTQKKALPYKYEMLELIDANFVRFGQSGKYGLLSPDRKVILKAEWDKIEVFKDEKIIIAMQNDYYSIFFLNANIKVYMNYPFTRFDPYKDGMALVVQKGKYGFIDRDGLLLVSTQYDEARPFSNGCAAIKIGNVWGFIDKKENFVATPFYDKVLDFDNRAVIVTKNGKFGLVNRQGKETIKPQFEEITLLKSGNYLLKKEGRYGIANAEGIEKINSIYKDVLELKSGNFRVRLYGKYNLVDIDNKLLTQAEFDNIEYSESTRQYVYTTKFEWQPLK